MKLVAFDVGNVLVDVNFDEFVSFLGNYMEEPQHWLNTIHALHDVGHITMEQAFASKKELKEHVQTLIDAWYQVVQPKYNMIDFVSDLDNKYRVTFALWSNMGLEHYTYLSNNYKMKPLFDNFINHLSFQVGARKPTKLFYQSFFIQHPQFNDVLFIDDLEENLNHNWINYNDLKSITYDTFQFNEYDIESSQLEINSKIKSLEGWFF